MKNPRNLVAPMLVAAFCAVPAQAYEINNHADMSETAVLRSVLNLDNASEGKLFRIGLSQRTLDSDRQTFPLGSGLGPIPYCFGSERPFPFKVTTWTLPRQQAGEEGKQPNWIGNGTTLSIAQLIRYGACYEDEEDPYSRSISHFYDPQHQGVGATLGPSSLDWMLKRNPGPNLLSGDNHYTWMDARDSFYNALTANDATKSSSENAYERRFQWGKTFQALGHIVHHLQDMGSPQHVRSDDHCNSEKLCRDSLVGQVLGLYRPSGYEMYFEQQVAFVRNLATTATVPMSFGLPREFWNTHTEDNLHTLPTTSAAAQSDGIAAYTSTNFTSAGKDFLVGRVPNSTTNTVLPASGLPLPKPSLVFKDVPMTDLFSGLDLENVRVNLCNGDAAKCKLQFMGTETDPSARTSAASVFSQKTLRPETAYSGPGAFQQNFFTYADAGNKLVPRAVEYSAGLINYFFRGEFSIRPPEETMYALLDGADELSTCKDTCGFRKIRARVTNVTSPINGGAQNMAAGKLVAVVRFSRNNCYAPDWSGDLGELNSSMNGQYSTCYYGGGTEAIDEFVASAPIDVTQMAVGAEQSFTFDFSAKPIPINAWNIRLQVVFRGTLGGEPDAVATSTVRLSAPTVFRAVNEMDWFWFRQKFYKVADIRQDQAVLWPMAATRILPNDCFQVLNQQDATIYLDDTCLRPLNQLFHVRTSAGVNLANTPTLAAGQHSMLVMLGDVATPFVIGVEGNMNPPTFYRELFWNDALQELDGRQFWNYRGWHLNAPVSFIWSWADRLGEPPPNWDALKSRPAPPDPTPTKFDWIDPRYQ